MRRPDDRWPNALRHQRMTGQTLVMVAAWTAIDAAQRMNGACPSSEEVRMLRAIASSAVDEAIVRGESHGSFRGFRIDAARLLCTHSNDSRVLVELVVALDGHIVESRDCENSAAAFCMTREVLERAMLDVVRAAR